MVEYFPASTSWSISNVYRSTPSHKGAFLHLTSIWSTCRISVVCILAMEILTTPSVSVLRVSGVKESDWSPWQNTLRLGDNKPYDYPLNFVHAMSRSFNLSGLWMNVAMSHHSHLGNGECEELICCFRLICCFLLVLLVRSRPILLYTYMQSYSYITNAHAYL